MEDKLKLKVYESRLQLIEAEQKELMKYGGIPVYDMYAKVEGISNVDLDTADRMFLLEAEVYEEIYPSMDISSEEKKQFKNLIERVKQGSGIYNKRWKAKFKKEII